MSPKRIGIYPGTFDPITLGHLDMIKRASHLFDELVVGVAENAEKKPMFTLEERVSFLKEALGDTVTVRSFSGLLVDVAKEVGAQVIVRGLRAVSDFEFEFQMAWTNKRICPDIETLFLMSSEKYQFVASRIVKEIARLDGDVSLFVTPPVAQALKKRSAEI